MLRRLFMAKRFAAVCGIALTLLSCMHQARALCVLTGCQGELEAPSGEAAPCASTCCGRGAHAKPGACLHEHGDAVCSAACMPSQTTPGCPHDSECTCCQFQPAANYAFSADASVSVMDAWSAEAPSSVLIEIAQANDRVEAVESVIAPLRATDVCAALCRFLT